MGGSRPPGDLVVRYADALGTAGRDGRPRVSHQRGGRDPRCPVGGRPTAEARRYRQLQPVLVRSRVREHTHVANHRSANRQAPAHDTLRTTAARAETALPKRRLCARLMARLANRRPLHHVSRCSAATIRLQQHVADSPDARTCRDSGREHPRCPDHSARWTPPCECWHPAMEWKFHWSLGGRYAGGRNHELQREHGVAVPSADGRI